MPIILDRISIIHSYNSSIISTLVIFLSSNPIVTYSKANFSKLLFQKSEIFSNIHVGKVLPTFTMWIQHVYMMSQLTSRRHSFFSANKSILLTLSSSHFDDNIIKKGEKVLLKLYHQSYCLSF